MTPDASVHLVGEDIDCAPPSRRLLRSVGHRFEADVSGTDLRE